MKKIFFKALFLSLLLSSIAHAAVVQFGADTTATFTAGSCTILSGSKAASVDIGANTLAVIMNSGDDFTINCPSTIQLTTTPAVGESCPAGGNRQYRQTAGSTFTQTFTAAAVTTSCGTSTAGGGGSASGGGGGSSSSNSSSSAAGTPAGEVVLSYVQLPEKSSTQPQTVNDKDVKFPSSGKVTKKTLMKNNQNGSSLLLTLGSKATSAGKAFTGTISGPKDLLPASLPTNKFPKGATFLRAVNVEYSAKVMVNGKFQLNIALPLGTKTDMAKDKKRFQIYLWNGKKWVKMSDAALSSNGMSVYTKTPKYGMFILMDTTPQKKAQ
ncbi:MAG: hypothetical protein AAB551_00380 [Patescibacteria group bacterium]